MPLQSPLLDQYNQDGIVTPALQQALTAARQKMAQAQLPGAPSPEATPRQLTPPGAMAVPAISRTPAPSQPGAMAQPGLVSSGAQPGAMAQPLASPGPSLAVSAGPRITDPDADAHLAERDRLIRTGSGIDQVKNPWVRGLLRAADIAGSFVAPTIAAGIPGTTYHHSGLVRQADRTVADDTANAKENAGTAETEAQASKANAETENLLHPKLPLDWAESAEPAVDPEHPELGPQHFFYNKADPAQKKFGGTMAAKPTQDNQQENTHVLPDGTVIAVHNDPKSGKSTAEVLYQGKAAEKPGHVIQRSVNGKIHNILVDAETGQDRQDLGEGRQPIPADHGTTVIGPDGKILRLEPGQTAPQGFTTPQQAGTANATEGKGIKSANDAVKYGQDYIKSGQFTGPKDEALLEAFFEVAKPSSGFRMSQPQIDMLMKGRSWMDSAEGIAYHAKTGVWFPPEQRQQIVDAMQARAASKGGGGKSGEQAPPTVKTKAERDALPPGTTYIGPDGKQATKPK